jgi:hypothetical protein
MRPFLSGFRMRRRVQRTPPERGRWPSRVAVSTWALRRARERPGRSPGAPVAWSSRRLSYVERNIETPVLPPIFDTILGLGATGFRGTCPHPFLHLRGRFWTLAVVVTFSPFLAGEFRRLAKIACVNVHRCHDISPPEKNKTKTYKREGVQEKKKGARRNFKRWAKLWAGKRNFRPRGT